ncbi:hypothetical protein GUJ93_ZPchr0012g21721 [Zizania palustris]|uniref:Uncharacterized protein n=1 Tax=Zizania palustris TaxID=103762 RepID=A0A8J6BW18_ZIZPA|nr:hypothetical protein GUJ93_ZPchr0012g21721 [Zizania palustris]
MCLHRPPIGASASLPSHRILHASRPPCRLCLPRSVSDHLRPPPPLSRPPQIDSQILARPQALDLYLLLASRAPSVSRFHRPSPRRLLVVRPVAALRGGGFADVGDLFGRVEAFLYTVMDAAVSVSSEVAQGGAKEAAGDWLSGITNSMETVLKVRFC